MPPSPMPSLLHPSLLRSKRGLVVGITNEHSLAHGCAEILHDLGAELAVTYHNARAERFVRPLAERLKAKLILPLDVQVAGELEEAFSAIAKEWGGLDFLIHAIAFCPAEDLHGRVIDCSLAGFQTAMQVSCHAFLRMAQLAEKLMPNGGALVTMSYYGADKVLQNDTIMGPVKAALEASVRAMAVELGPKKIRVHALSPGPLRSHAASGIAHFDTLIEAAIARAPENRLVEIEEVGAACAFLVSDASSGMTGDVTYVDGGYHITR
jgi:enoyl-[acyl-carrier protein] reductase I